jgi:hypothetical protein
MHGTVCQLFKHATPGRQRHLFFLFPLWKSARLNFLFRDMRPDVTRLYTFRFCDHSHVFFCLFCMTWDAKKSAIFECWFSQEPVCADMVYLKLGAKRATSFAKYLSAYGRSLDPLNHDGFGKVTPSH